MVSAFVLSLTPYNLQLISPNTQMDAFATFTLLAVMILSFAVVALLSAAISSHILIVLHQDNMIATIVSGVEMAIAALFACLSVTLNWSLQIYLIVLTALLLALYIVNIFIKNNEQDKLRVADNKINWKWTGIVIAIAIIAIVIVIAVCERHWSLTF